MHYWLFLCFNINWPLVQHASFSFWKFCFLKAKVPKKPIARLYMLAQKFHLLVRQHSKIVKEARRLTSKTSTNQMRKDCHCDIHKFARRILDEDNYASIKPSFCKEQAEEYFSRAYSTTPKSFSHPDWMPNCPQPSTPMITAPFTEEEVSEVISGLKSSSAPSPADQIPYTVIKQCMPLLVACSAPHVQLLLGHPGNPCSMEGWHCSLTWQEEGSGQFHQSFPLPPYCPHLMCK